MEFRCDNINIGNKYGLCTFVSLNGTKIYSVFKKINTTLKQIIDNFNDNYKCNDLESHCRIEFYSNILNRHLNADDIDKKIEELNLPAKFDLQLKMCIDQNKKNEEDNLRKLKYQEKFESDLLMARKNENNKNKMELYVKLYSGEILVLYLLPTDTIDHIKSEIYKQTNIRKDSQRIIITGQQLNDEKTIHDYNIQSKSTLYLILRLCGGMYHETSGKNGNYKWLRPNILFVN